MTTQATKFEQTHIAMVLDRSGSMDCCRKATIDAVNKYLLEARGDSVLKEADFQLMTFDTDSIDTVRNGAPINVKDITMEDYVPRGGTPLYDAVGRGIDTLDGKLAGGSGKAILVIVTDGAENSSRKYQGEPGRRQIKEMITARQSAGWLVVFLGAGLDAAAQGLALGVAAGATADIAMDEVALAASTHAMYSMSRSYAAQPNREKAGQLRASGALDLSASTRKAMGDASGGAGLLGRTKVPPAAKAPVQAPTAPVAPVAKAGDTWDKKEVDAWSK